MYVCSKEYLLAGFYNQIVQEGSSVLLHALHRGGGVRGVRRGRGDCARQHRGREWQRAAVRGRGRGDRGERADHGAVRPPRHQDPGNLLETSCLVTYLPRHLASQIRMTSVSRSCISTVHYLPIYRLFITNISFSRVPSHIEPRAVSCSQPLDRRTPANQLLTEGHRTYTATRWILPAQNPLFIEPLLSAPDRPQPWWRGTTGPGEVWAAGNGVTAVSCLDLISRRGKTLLDPFLCEKDGTQHSRAQLGMAASHTAKVSICSNCLGGKWSCVSISLISRDIRWHHRIFHSRECGAGPEFVPAVISSGQSCSHKYHSFGSHSPD